MTVEEIIGLKDDKVAALDAFRQGKLSLNINDSMELVEAKYSALFELSDLIESGSLDEVLSYRGQIVPGLRELAKKGCENPLLFF